MSARFRRRTSIGCTNESGKSAGSPFGGRQRLSSDAGRRGQNDFLRSRAGRCRRARRKRNALSAVYYPATAGLFATLRVPLLRGRDFTARDSVSAPWVAIINQTMARMFWPNEDPIGKQLTLDLVPEERPREIVGIVGDVKVSRLQTKPEPAMYVPHAQRPARYRGPYQWTRIYMSYLIRPSGDASSRDPGSCAKPWRKSIPPGRSENSELWTTCWPSRCKNRATTRCC